MLSLIIQDKEDRDFNASLYYLKKNYEFQCETFEMTAGYKRYEIKGGTSELYYNVGLEHQKLKCNNLKK